MPRTTIEFNDDEREELNTCLNGWKYFSVLRTLDNHLRSRTKYAGDDDSEEAVKALYETRDYLHSLLNSENIEL